MAKRPARTSESARVSSGVTNVLDMAVTRGGDALASLVVLHALSTSDYAAIGLSQSFIAPLFLFFINPGSILSRDYWKWKDDPAALRERANSFRFFNRLLFFAAAIGCVFLSEAIYGDEYAQIAFATLWALMISVGQSILNVDREILRFSLDSRKLLGLNFAHKASLVALVAYLLNFAGVGIRGAAIGVAIHQIAFMTIYQAAAFGPGELMSNLFYRRGILAPSLAALKEFSFAYHLNWVAFTTLQTLDVLTWGTLRPESKAALGVYSGVLKVTNLVTAVPGALGITLMIWFARNELPARGRAKRELGVETKGLLVVIALTSFLLAGLWFFREPIFQLISRGRWSADAFSAAMAYLRGLLPAYGLFAIISYYWYVMSVRVRPALFLVRYNLPMLGMAGILYYGVAVKGDLVDLARTNLSVAAVMVFTLALHRLVFFERPKKGNEPPLQPDFN